MKHHNLILKVQNAQKLKQDEFNKDFQAFFYRFKDLNICFQIQGKDIQVLYEPCSQYEHESLSSHDGDKDQKYPTLVREI